MQIPNELLQWLDPRYIQIKDRIESGAVIEASLWLYLQESEQQLIDLMNQNPPGPNAPGNIEVSWALYFLNNKTPAWFASLLRDAGMPPTTITSADWTQWDAVWSKQGVLMGDGSLVSYATYAIVDPGWATSLFNYLLLYLGYIQKHSFGNTPATLNITGKTDLVIGVFGDWGTGNYTDGNLSASPSQLIKQNIAAMNPDINIHLGDVYYAGTDSEEQTKLLDCWPAAPLGNFTLNSNHEMYVGANGLFGVSLASPVFSCQQGTTYFQLAFGNWLIIGLDTAYYDNSSLFMDGAITDPAQISFLQKAGASGKNICLLTHHNPLDTTGQNQTALWAQVINALGKNPDYWYWGHVHNGMMYSSGSAGGPVNCRCLGNAAIPIGNAEWLQNSPSTISFYTNKPLPNPTVQQQLRVQNGFAMLHFTANSLSEEWYYQDGTPV